MGSSASTADTSKPVVVNKPIGDKPRFSYFPVHGKGLPVLLLMELHGMQYDGNVVGMEAWGEVKGSGMCPFGQLPILETADCGTVAQQQAILRYIEAKTESESKDLKEQVRVSMALNLSEELCQAFATVQPNQLQKDKPAEPCKKFWEEKLPEYLAKVEKFLDGKNGFSESGKSSADAHMYATLHQMRCLQPDLLDKTPAVKTFYERVDALEPVQKVLTGQSAFGGFIQMFLSLAEAQPEAKDAATAAPAAAATEAAPAADTKTNLYIFPFRPAAAPVLAMEVHGMPYRVQRVNFDKWPELKGSGVPPFGQLPTLETEEGITIGQSAAVMQYIGEKTKSKGKDLREETVSRMLLACVPDLMNMMRAGQPWMQQMEKTQEENDKLWNEQLPTQFANFEKLLDGKDRFTESGTTVGELALFVILGNILPLRDAVLEKAPNLQKFCDRISGLDATKKLREGKSPAGELAPVFFKFGEKPAEEKKEEAKPEEKKEEPKAEGEAEKKEEPKAEGEAEKKEAPKEEKKDDKPAEEKEEAPKPAE